MKIKILILLITINLITMTATAQLAESYHPYAANFAYTWPAITEPGATQMRLHFTKVELTWGSVLKIQNANGKTLATIDNFQADLNLKNLKEDFWTDWFTTDTLKVRLETDKYGGSYGFLIDQKETRKSMAPPSVLPESYHPYAANFAYIWPAITEPGATQMRLHFTKVELTWGSVLKIQNANGKTLATIDNFQADLNLKNLKEDFWTDWFTTDTLKVRLETDKYGGSYGFLIDQKETRKSMAPSTVTTTPPSTNTPTYTNAPPPTSTPRFTPIQALTPSPQDSFETEPTNTPIYTNVPSTISTPRFTPIQAPYSWQDNMWLYIVVTLIIGIITEKIIRRR